MQPLDINNLVRDLQNIDPTKNSIDENIAPTSKIGFLAKWIGRILHFITCGCYTKNAKLDAITRQITSLASQHLPTALEEKEKEQYIRAFTNLKAIDQENEGSEQDSIEQLIFVIRAYTLKKPNPTKPTEPPIQSIQPAPTPPPAQPIQTPTLPPRTPSPAPAHQPPTLPPAEPPRFPTPQPPSPVPATKPTAPELPVEKPQSVLDQPQTAEDILKQVERMLDNDSRLLALADKLAADSQFTGHLINMHTFAISKLFLACKENFNFKVVVAHQLMLQNNSYNLFADVFSEEVWKEVARRLPLDARIDTERNPMRRKPEYVVAFINAFAARADLQNEKKGSQILENTISRLLNDTELSHNVTPLATLSPQAVALANIPIFRWGFLFRENDAISAIHPFFKAYTEQESYVGVIWRYVVNNFPPEKLQLLPWKEYPRWLQIFLAHRAGQLTDVSYLRNICKEMTVEDISKVLECLRNCDHFPVGLNDVLVDTALDQQPPVVQQLIFKALEDPSLTVVLPPKVWDCLDVSLVWRRPARMKLLHVLTQPARRKALQAWDFNYFEFEDNNPPPLAIIIRAEENPTQLKGVFNVLFGKNDCLNIRNTMRNRIPKGCKDTLDAMEETPWKLCAALYHVFPPIDTNDDEWQSCAKQYPRVMSALQRHAAFLERKKDLETKLYVVVVETDESDYMSSFTREFRSNPQWNEVYQETIHNEFAEFFYAFLRHADPSSIALYLNEDDELMMFLALFDEASRENLIKAKGTSPAFKKLREMAQMVADSPALPDVAKSQAADFIKKLEQA